MSSPRSPYRERGLNAVFVAVPPKIKPAKDHGLFSVRRKSANGHKYGLSGLFITRDTMDSHIECVRCRWPKFLAEGRPCRRVK